MSTTGEGTRRFPLARSQRLRGRGTFKAVLDRGVRKWQGPIGLCVAANDAAVCRLGISIGRPVGNAATRNRIKRLLREAFRSTQHDWPVPVDLVVLVKKHEPMSLADYRRLIGELGRRCLTPRDPA